MFTFAEASTVYRLSHQIYADAFLQPNDGVFMSLWIIPIGMLAATMFFFAEASTVYRFSHIVSAAN